ncbi:ABC transporter ATP-binding protein [Paenibacillus thailandensis]|uniref:ABC transporter ATP-binding protein n=1 Tax=Paenibacillus thailandensis TaxID=393250 RepID=A0ABW5R4L4_9BACL
MRSHLFSHAPLYAAGVALVAAGNVVNALFPGVLGRFTDDLHRNGLSAGAVQQYSLMLLAIGIGYGVLFGGGQLINHRLGRMFEFKARQKLFGHFTGLSEHYFSKNGGGKLLSYFMNDVTAVRESIANGLNQMTNASVLLVSVVAMMSFSSIPLYLVAVCVLPLLAIPLLVVYFGPRIRRKSAAVQEALASMTASAEEQFGGIRVTKTFAAEEVARSRFGETVDRIRANQLKLVRSSSLFQSALPFTGALSLVIAILYGGYLTIHGQLSLGGFVALTLYLRMIINPLQQIGNIINMIQRSRASLERLNALLDVQPDIREAEDAVVLAERAPVSLSIRGLTFAYPDSDHEVLRDIDIELPAGQTLGIVGKTGSGKTTLVKLLLRVYDPPAGTVRLNGIDVLDLTVESLRERIGYVPQDGFLFSTTIRDNIAFFNRQAEDAAVEEAAKLADIHANIQGFPDRFLTKLGERGLTLSGGQRQRTSLARGIVKKAPLLILDDSVSAVDTVTESRILANLRSARKGMTNIVIAHRISAVRHADRIIVLENGGIAESGTHEELLQKGGYYASLHAIQEEGALE